MECFPFRSAGSVIPLPESAEDFERTLKSKRVFRLELEIDDAPGYAFIPLASGTVHLESHPFERRTLSLVRIH